MNERNFARRCIVAAVVLFASALSGISRSASAAEAPDPKTAAYDTIRSLVGTWVHADPEKPGTITFKLTSNGSAIVETMMPGTEHEMVNVYYLDGDKITMTHYCAMGNQPRLQAPAAGTGPVQFSFIDGGNLKSRNQPHMDSLEITVKDDHLTEKWVSYADGKVTGQVVFEFKRQK